MKQKLSLVFLLFFLILGTVTKAQCDPWIQQAYQQLLKRSANAQECNIRNYNNGSWGSYAELLGYVAGYNKKGDPWIYRAYWEMYQQLPEAADVNIYNYNHGTWHSYDELKRYIQSYHAAVIQEKTERIQASYLLAFGRKANQSEVNYWLSQPGKTVAEYLANHRQFAVSDKGTMKSLITKSYQDILGRVPTQAELNYWMSGNQLYVDLTKNHIRWLSDNPAEYENVIKRSYEKMFGRQPETAEINYWKSQGVLSYVVLLSCHEEWKRTNGQTAKKISGSSSISTNGLSLQTIPVSDKVANEVKLATGLTNGGNGGGNVIAAGGGNVIAAGGGNVVAAGGLN